MSLPIRTLAAAFGLLMAAGCGTDDPATAKVDYSCPRIVALANAARVPVFTPGMPAAPENLIYRAHIANTHVSCEIGNRTITATVSLGLKFEAGPAPATGQMTQEFFVATTEMDTTVLSKESRALTVVLPPGVPIVETTTRVEDLTIQIAEGKTNRNYEIVVGFQLTPEQDQFLRANPGL